VWESHGWHFLPVFEFDAAFFVREYVILFGAVEGVMGIEKTAVIPRKDYWCISKVITRVESKSLEG
jgi:hypothetical protein